MRNPHNQEAKYIANTEDEVAEAILNTNHNKLWAATGPNNCYLYTAVVQSCTSFNLTFHDEFVLRYTLVQSKIQPSEKSKCFETLHTYLNKGTYE